MRLLDPARRGFVEWTPFEATLAGFPEFTYERFEDIESLRFLFTAVSL